MPIFFGTRLKRTLNISVTSLAADHLGSIRFNQNMLMTSLSCGTPTAQVIKWSGHRDHLDRQVLTWNWSNAYKRSHIIYTSVLPFLPLLSFAFVMDSFAHSLTCRNSITSIARSFRASSPGISTCSINWVSALFLVQLLKKETVYLGLFYFSTPRCLPMFPFTFSSLQDVSLYDLSLADPGKGTARFDVKSKVSGVFSNATHRPFKKSSPLTFGRILGKACVRSC